MNPNLTWADLVVMVVRMAIIVAIATYCVYIWRAFGARPRVQEAERQAQYHRFMGLLDRVRSTIAPGARKP